MKARTLAGGVVLALALTACGAATVSQAESFTPIASFNWEHEARSEDPFQQDSGINAFEWTWPDGTKEWCFTYLQTGTVAPEMRCKPQPTNTPIPKETP